MGKSSKRRKPAPPDKQVSHWVQYSSVEKPDEDIGAAAPAFLSQSRTGAQLLAELRNQPDMPTQGPVFYWMVQASLPGRGLWIALHDSVDLSSLTEPIRIKMVRMALQGETSIEDIPDFLVEHFGQAFRIARQSPGYKNRQLRSPTSPIQMEHEGRPLSLGDQLPFSARQNTLLAFLYSACRLFAAQLGTGDQGPLRKDAFIGIIGATGVGKTTVLLELVHQLKAFFDSQGSKSVFSSIAKAAGLKVEAHSDQLHDAFLNYTTNALSTTIVLSLEKDPLLRSPEIQLPISKIFALRCLFGSISYLTVSSDSPLGGYDGFLKVAAVKQLIKTDLTFQDVHTFISRMSGVEDSWHLLVLLCDEANAAEIGLDKSKDEAGQKTWLQLALRDFLSHWLADNTLRAKCITLPVISSGSISSANLGVDAYTGTRARIMLLPMVAPSVRQQLVMLGVLCNRARADGIQDAPSMADVLNASDRFKSALAQLSNFRLTAQFLALLGGSNFADDVAGWTLGTFCTQLKAAIHNDPPSILTRAMQNVERSINSLLKKMLRITSDEVLKSTILRRVMVMALLEDTIRLRDRIVPQSKATWGMLAKAGLLNPIFVDPSDEGSGSVFMDARAILGKESLQTPKEEASEDDSDEDEPMPEQEDQPSSSQHPKSPGIVPALAALDLSEAMSLQTETLLSPTSEKGTTPRMSQRLTQAITKMAQSCEDPQDEGAVVQVVPAIMSAWYNSAAGQMDAPVLQDLCYFESPDRKEAVDLAAITLPLFLRRTELEQVVVRIQELIRMHFYPPGLRSLIFRIPAANTLLGRSYHITSSRLWVSGWREIVKQGRNALTFKTQDFATSVDCHRELVWTNTDKAPLAWAFRGPGNEGCDSVVFLKTLTGSLVTIVVQSKLRKEQKSDSIAYALLQGKSNLEKHGWEDSETTEVDKDLVEALDIFAVKKGRGQKRLSVGTKELQNAVTGVTNPQRLEKLEQIATDALPASPKLIEDHLYLFVTDAHMADRSLAHYRILALAGHPIASRMLIVSGEGRAKFYGEFIATKRLFLKS